MNKDTLKTMSLAELESKRLSILNSQKHWKNCQDGSYEMALHYAGYNDCMNEIYRRETE